LQLNKTVRDFDKHLENIIAQTNKMSELIHQLPDKISKQKITRKFSRSED